MRRFGEKRTLDFCGKRTLDFFDVVGRSRLAFFPVDAAPLVAERARGGVAGAGVDRTAAGPGTGFPKYFCKEVCGSEAVSTVGPGLQCRETFRRPVLVA